MFVDWGFPFFSLLYTVAKCYGKPKARDPSNLVHHTDEIYHHPYV